MEYEKPIVLSIAGLDPCGGVGLLLKGGHHETVQGMDILFVQSRSIPLMPTVKQVHTKHVSGCILSSSIASLLEKMKV